MAFAITLHICWGTLKNICVLILENGLLNVKSVITRVAKKKTWKNIWCYIDDKHLINGTYLKDLQMLQYSFSLRLSLFIILLFYFKCNISFYLKSYCYVYLYIVKLFITFFPTFFLNCFCSEMLKNKFMYNKFTKKKSKIWQRY